MWCEEEGLEVKKGNARKKKKRPSSRNGIGTSKVERQP
jgi:hypothetical protein